MKDSMSIGNDLKMHLSGRNETLVVVGMDEFFK